MAPENGLRIAVASPRLAGGKIDYVKGELVHGSPPASSEGRQVKCSGGFKAARRVSHASPARVSHDVDRRDGAESRDIATEAATVHVSLQGLWSTGNEEPEPTFAY